MFKLGDFVKYDVDDCYGVAYVIGHMKLENNEILPVIANKNFIGMPINDIFLKLIETNCTNVTDELRQRYIANFGELA